MSKNDYIRKRAFVFNGYDPKKDVVNKHGYGCGAGEGCGSGKNYERIFMKTKSISEKEIRQEIDEIVSFCGSGGGYGDPDAEKADNKKLEWLKEQLRLKEQQKNNFYVFLGVFSTLDPLQK